MSWSDLGNHRTFIRDVLLEDDAHFIFTHNRRSNQMAALIPIDHYDDLVKHRDREEQKKWDYLYEVAKELWG